MSVYHRPCRFNFQFRSLTGHSFVYYHTRTYNGHERLRCEVRDDRADYRRMLILMIRHRDRVKTRASV